VPKRNRMLCQFSAKDVKHILIAIRSWKGNDTEFHKMIYRHKGIILRRSGLQLENKLCNNVR
jgi:hypothetical protein